MSRAVPRRARIAWAAVALLAAAAPAGAQRLSADYTAAELLCMRRADRADVQGFAGIERCIASCLADYRAGRSPLSNCAFPFGGTTATCLFDAARGAKPPAVAAIVAACRADTPECYVPQAAASITQWANDELSFSQAAIEFVTAQVYCDDYDGTPATAAVARCEHAVLRNLAKHWRAARALHSRCKQAEAHGRVALGSCGPPATDPRTAAGAAAIDARIAAAIDRACVPGAGRPACHAANGYPNGAAWVSLSRSALDPIALPLVFCGR